MQKRYRAAENDFKTCAPQRERMDLMARFVEALTERLMEIDPTIPPLPMKDVVFLRFSRISNMRSFGFIAMYALAMIKPCIKFLALEFALMLGIFCSGMVPNRQKGTLCEILSPFTPWWHNARVLLLSRLRSSWSLGAASGNLILGT